MVGEVAAGLRKTVNLYVLLAAILASLGLAGAAGWEGYHLGQDSVIAAQAKQQKLVAQIRDAALAGAAEAISEIEVKRVTIRQLVDRQIIEKPVYRDCVNTPDGMRYINEARTGESEPAPDRQLPALTVPDG